MPNRQISALIAALVLAACGAPATPAPVLPPTPPAQVATRGSVVDFAPYTQPAWGYTVAAPRESAVSSSTDGRQTILTYEDEAPFGGSLIIEIEVIPELGATTAEGLLAPWLAGREQSSAIRPVRGADGTLGVAASFQEEEGAKCEQMRNVVTAFVKGSTGYLLQIRPDATSRCDAETLPETESIIGSFRLP